MPAFSLRMAVVSSLLVALASACAADDPSTAAVSVTSTPTTAPSSATPTTTATGSSGGTATTPTPLPTAPVTAAPTVPMAPDLTAVGITATLVAQLDEPVSTAVRPADPRPGTLYVAQRGGRVVALGADGRVSAEPVVDLSARTAAGGERGLLGLAFSPDGAHLYVNYTDLDGNTNVDELTMTANGTADPASRRRLLFQTQPFANHNGGHLTFGPDGYLYIGLGDGGSGGDPLGNAQDLGSLLGKMLRIDPRAEGSEPYGIPADNPFVSVAGARPEIWSSGLRNPWRYAFDAATGDLWIGDVGQNAVEEIDVTRAAEGAGRAVNFGWPAFEGTAPFNPGVTAPDAVAPIFEYRHGGGVEGGCSVTGGVVYRGSRLPALAGAYLFADYCVAGVRAIPAAGGGERRLLDGPATVVHFGEGADGEVFVLSLDGGVYRLDPA